MSAIDRPRPKDKASGAIKRRQIKGGDNRRQIQRAQREAGEYGVKIKGADSRNRGKEERAGRRVIKF